MNQHSAESPISARVVRSVSEACVFRRRGAARRPLVPHSPCGTPGRATCPGEVGSPASRDCIHPFERRLRLCDPEVATVNSSSELTVGSLSGEKPAVTRAVIVPTHFLYKVAGCKLSTGRNLERKPAFRFHFLQHRQGVAAVENVNCSCDGLNENCMWCGGTGIRMKSPPDPASTVTCRRCGAEVKTSAIEGHLAEHEKNFRVAQIQRLERLHQSLLDSLDRLTRTSEGPTPSRRSVQCPVCYAYVQPSALKSHISLEHSVRRHKRKVRCRKCGVVLTLSELFAHLRSVPGHRRGQVPRKDGTLRKRPDNISFTRDQTPAERRLDATKNYAHNFREFGRYGSHPSHDDFSDDGKP